MKEITIQPQQEGKGRSFSAMLVATVEAGAIARGNDPVRPVLMAVASTENELRPFVANLRTGKKAEESRRRGQKYEILKSAGYQCAWQRTPKGSLATLFAPDLFCLDPGMVDPAGVRFVMLAARSWLRPVDAPLPTFVPAERHDDVLALAPLFMAYLDRRTRCPLIPDPRFYVNVFAGALDQGLATFAATLSYRSQWGESTGYAEEGTADLGYAPGVYFRASHEALETFLADQVRAFFAAPAKEKAA